MPRRLFCLERICNSIEQVADMLLIIERRPMRALLKRKDKRETRHENHTKSMQP